MVKTLSPLATQIPKLKDTTDRTAPVYGLAIHTTGSTIVAKARKANADPLEFAVAYYSRPDTYWSHYVIGWSGEIVQISDEKERAQHIGLSAADRKKYLSGEWVKQVPEILYRRWELTWMGHGPSNYLSPSHLYPGSSPNNVYVGVELLPVDALAMREYYDPGIFGWFDNWRFTKQQAWSVVELAKDLAKRHGWPDGWHWSGRLCGHEDVHPLSRFDKGGGWDPGSLRKAPYFDLGFIRARCGSGPGLSL